MHWFCIDWHGEGGTLTLNVRVLGVMKHCFMHFDSDAEIAEAIAAAIEHEYTVTEMPVHWVLIADDRDRTTAMRARVERELKLLIEAPVLG
jgi:L-alanine-DL-glutamate epimerase-like enolase superfamily enzyme